MTSNFTKFLSILTISVGFTACQTSQVQPDRILGKPYDTEGSFHEICAQQTTNKNSKLDLSQASDDWFQVYETSPGVFAIVEPYQFQETISYLITGTSSALLYDTGLGLKPIRPVVERLTSLPVTVLNSHTHYDHVGGNAEFSSILAVDSDYTRANMAGFGTDVVAADIAPDAFCDGAPTGVELSNFTIKPWQASQYITDGEILDLGDRKLEILHVPGHTPDATALLDKENGLLFTGDTYYDAELWLFVPETNLDHYENSLERLVTLENNLKYLHGAHRSALVDSGELVTTQKAFHKLREYASVDGVSSGEPVMFVVDGIDFVTSKAALDGHQIDTSHGGSGLEADKDN